MITKEEVVSALIESGNMTEQDRKVQGPEFDLCWKYVGGDIADGEILYIDQAIRMMQYVFRCEWDCELSEWFKK